MQGKGDPCKTKGWKAPRLTTNSAVTQLLQPHLILVFCSRSAIFLRVGEGAHALEGKLFAELDKLLMTVLCFT